MSEQFAIKTKFRDIKRQLVGRCPEVLALLGINPLAMSFGVDCPVNEHHRGLASFQVDPVANRYYCTYCKPRGASLVDLVMDLEKASTFAEATSFLRRNLCLESKPYFLGTEAEEGFIDSEDEVEVVDKSIVQMIAMTKPAGHSKYCLKRRIPPLGANITTAGNLYIQIRDNELLLRGILEIDPQGARLIHKDEPLNGSAIALGPVNDAPLIALTLDWESAVALYIMTGGMPCLAYLEQSNLLDCVDMFITDSTKGIFIFGTPQDSIEMIDSAKDYIEGLGKKIHIHKTKNHDYCEEYTNVMNNLKL